MPEQVQCPSCKQKLRVPDNLLGKKVKCPKCESIFDARVQEVGRDDEGGGYGFTQEPEPELKKRPVRKMADEVEDDQFDEDDEPEEDEYEERSRRKKSKKLRKANQAKQKVFAPAISLLILGSIGLCLVLISVPAVLLTPPDPAMAPGPAQRIQAQRVGNLVGAFVGVILYLIIILGSFKMKNMESYGISVLISILAIIPCTCCFVALPFGIWSLVVINSSDVKPYFRPR